MKSLRHVKVNFCNLKVSDGYELNSFPQLDKVVSFSTPCLSSGKDVEWLQQRLPAVRELGCILDCIEERVETLEFYRKLESLKLCIWGTRRSYLINFPSTLIKLKLDGFQLSWTDISSIVELQCLSFLKLLLVSFPGPTREMEDMKFPKLKYLELSYSNLEIWNADTISFPSLEQFVSFGSLLEELQFEQFEFDNLPTQKMRIEMEEKSRNNTIRIITTVEEIISKKLAAKDEEISKISKINFVLEERVQSLCVENQIWRQLARSNEAIANA